MQTRHIKGFVLGLWVMFFMFGWLSCSQEEHLVAYDFCREGMPVTYVEDYISYNPYKIMLMVPGLDYMKQTLGKTFLYIETNPNAVEMNVEESADVSTEKDNESIEQTGDSQNETNSSQPTALKAESNPNFYISEDIVNNLEKALPIAGLKVLITQRISNQTIEDLLKGYNVLLPVDMQYIKLNNFNKETMKTKDFDINLLSGSALLFNRDSTARLILGQFTGPFCEMMVCILCMESDYNAYKNAIDSLLKSISITPEKDYNISVQACLPKKVVQEEPSSPQEQSIEGSTDGQDANTENPAEEVIPEGNNPSDNESME